MNIVVFVTAKDKQEAQKIARRLVEDKLIACANIVDGVKSVFWWQGKTDEADETLLIMKSEKRLFKKIAAAVKALHSYDLPEVIALPIVDGSADYLKWMKESLSRIFR